VVKLPFCEFCVRTRLLCHRCQSLIDGGEYQWLDVEVSAALLAAGQRVGAQDLEYVKSYDIGDLVVVLMRNAKKLSRSAHAALERELSAALRRGARVIEYGGMNEVVAQLISPARLLTISTSWLPDGTTETTIKIPARESRKLPIRPEALQAVISKIFSVRVKVELVRERELRA
jgi:transcription antitermination factor NusA-like protein